MQVVVVAVVVKKGCFCNQMRSEECKRKVTLGLPLLHLYFFYISVTVSFSLELE